MQIDVIFDFLLLLFKNSIKMKNLIIKNNKKNNKDNNKIYSIIQQKIYYIQ